MIISLQKYASNMLIIFCRMALPHLLEHYYEENHRGQCIEAGEVTGFAGLSLFSTMLYCTNEQFAFVQVLPLLHPRTHDRFLEMWYDDKCCNTESYKTVTPCCQPSWMQDFGAKGRARRHPHLSSLSRTELVP